MSTCDRPPEQDRRIKAAAITPSCPRWCAVPEGHHLRGRLDLNGVLELSHARLSSRCSTAGLGHANFPGKKSSSDARTAASHPC